LVQEIIFKGVLWARILGVFLYLFFKKAILLLYYKPLRQTWKNQHKFHHIMTNCFILMQIF